MRKFTLFVLSFLIVSLSWAQTRTISGRVVDEKDNTPLEGITVTVVGSKTATTTNAEGRFTLQVGKDAKSLEFTATGYARQTRAIGENSVIEVSMTRVVAALDEVVVVGYGTQQKSKVTSAIGKVAAEDIAALATTSFDRQLAGRAAGMQVSSISGRVSEPPRIRIRGVNSITQNRDPLIVVDGIPTYDGGGTSGVVTTNTLADINPADIESYEILKDGSATAIYGSRAANGVILITTKKGKAGKLNLNYDVYYGYSEAFRVPNLLNADQFITVANEKLTNANLPIAAFANPLNSSTDWLKTIFNDNPMVQSHTLSVSGGNDKSTYYMSVNYLAQEGMVKTNTNERFNIRGNMEHRFNKWLKIGNNITLGKTIDNGQNDGGNALSGAIGGAMRALPNVRPLDANNPTGYNLSAGNVALGRDANTRDIENNYTNILYVLDKNKFSNTRYRIINNGFIEISPLKGLNIRSQGSVDFLNSLDFQSLDPLHGDGRGSLGSVFNQNIQLTLYTWQNYATYTKNFKDHSVTLVGGVEMQRRETQSFYGQGTTLSDPFFQTDNLISGSFVNQFSGGGLTKTGFQSYFGRLNYDYLGKYLLSFSARRDGSSRLSPDVRYGNFFGGSLGWRVSRENFWETSGLSRVINDFKIRASYAEVGNELAASFPWLSSYANAQYGGASGIAANRVGNPDLQWESTIKSNFGFDMAFWQNRINLAFDYFINKNNNQVLDEPQPVSLGIPGNIVTKNIGNMENRGIELSIAADAIRTKDFNWNIALNYTKLKNEVKSLAQGQTEVPLAGPNNGVFNILKIGNPINAFYGYNYYGVNPTNGNPIWVKANEDWVQYNNATTGAGYFLINRNDFGTLGAATSLGDRYVIGSSIPTWFGGLTNTFSYKGLSAEVFLRYQGGNKVYNLSRQEVWNSNGFVNNSTEILDRWKTVGQITNVPKVFYGRDNQTNLSGLGNSRFLENGEFLRLQNVMLSYTFGKSKIESFSRGFVKSLRIYVQGQNLAIWTDYTGIDPENISELGIDNSSIPQQRMYTAGLNIGF